MTADGWSGVPEFTDALALWRRIDSELSGSRPRGHQGLFFADPQIEDDRIVLTNGPSRAEDSDGYELLFISREADGYSLRRDRRTRGVDALGEQIAAFGTFEFAAKYVLPIHVMNTIRRGSIHSLPSLPAQFDKKGVAKGWREMDTVPGTAVKKFIYGSDETSDRYYVGDSRFPSPTHFLTMTFEQLNAVGIEGLPLPGGS
ncbi:hypothetical protein [Williamsia sp. M5A3_1d]